MCIANLTPEESLDLVLRVILSGLNADEALASVVLDDERGGEVNKSIGIAVAVVAAVLFAVATAPVAGGSPAYLNINGCVIEPSANCERANLRGANLRGAVLTDVRGLL